ncbi:ABC-type transporter, ATP-binding protein (ATPase) [Desulfamplus magnetovallimortis]|uniref:ABC-type transporter, ATP-binding protein (ATPase) n=1 Tax=Desulfamplus magnetovallimortis TaxID=1246637 RepID=A0A1W1HC79_9BACT|nr:ABC transporter ATP-binding protein [Desulfamplus magnetovallimortis]SLM30097.1 ABC-type transporter, ATP-binding protein (ATPase) [Desulfamplus magnetovallimortis]
MGLSLKNIHKRVDGEMHLADINLSFESGSRNVLLGRTLSGKTSLLRIMAGLDRPTSGQLLLDGRDITGLSVRKRSIAMVYQQFINYPSFTVYDNIASPLKVNKMDKKEIDRRVREAAQMLHLEEMLDRLPSELSGGQQQRTAIARAIVKDAELLLLDEPLVNLDYKLREELQIELQEIFKKRDAIVVYTTTEPAEALMLGGNIVVMDEGRILQTGETPHVYHHPATTRVAEVFSDPPINYIGCNVIEGTAHLGQDIDLTLSGHISGLSNGNYKFGVRCNHFFLQKNSEADIKLSAKLELSEINGSETFLHANFNGTNIVIQEVGIHSRKMGSEIDVFVNPACFFVYSESDELVVAPS